MHNTRSDPKCVTYHYRARAYDSTVGRFTQKDPLGIGGGVNLYVYVKGNPSNRKDPSGLKEVIPSLGGEILGEIAGFILEQGVGGVTGAVCASRYCKRKKANVAAFPSAYTECLNIFSQSPSLSTGARPGSDDFVYACANECSRITKLPEFKKQCNCRE